MSRILNLASSDSFAVDPRACTFQVCAVALAFAAVGCSSSPGPVDARAVNGQTQALTSAPSRGGHRATSAPGTPEAERPVLLSVLRGIQTDFGTTLTPRQLATRLNTPAESSEASGTWHFEPRSLFHVEANAMSLDSPVDWLRVTMPAELAIHLTDLTQLFSNDYDVLRGGAEVVAVEFAANARMHIAAELQSDRSAYISSAPVVSLQLRRPGYDPSIATLAPRAH